MITLTVSDEYAPIIADAAMPVVVVDPSGKKLGQIGPVDPAVAAYQGTPADVLTEIKRRMADSDGTRHSFAELIAKLNEKFPA